MMTKSKATASTSMAIPSPEDPAFQQSVGPTTAMRHGDMAIISAAASGIPSGSAPSTQTLATPSKLPSPTSAIVAQRSIHTSGASSQHQEVSPNKPLPPISHPIFAPQPPSYLPDIALGGGAHYAVFTHPDALRVTDRRGSKKVRPTTSAAGSGAMIGAAVAQTAASSKKKGPAKPKTTAAKRKQSDNQETGSSGPSKKLTIRIRPNQTKK
ncbi:hypothetical protein BD413DRAFT_38694 [Trametes elegans]|nr:hypothetical protein BD413DRAFT_38694 [Trametes elegans]